MNKKQIVAAVAITAAAAANIAIWIVPDSSGQAPVDQLEKRP